VAVSSIGQLFNVDKILTATGALEAKVVWNQFDEHGLVVGIKRNAAESNWEYKRRLFDVFTNRANSTYKGLVNGITRELGLSLFQPITINPKVDGDGVFLAEDPYIKFDGVYLLLYSDYTNNVLDWAIDRYEPGGNYEHLYRLVDAINDTSYFEANLDLAVYRETRSMTLINQSNRLENTEAVPSSTKFKLAYDHIVNGSVVFERTDLFLTEKTSTSTVASRGDFYIDYLNGIVTSYSIPGMDTVVRYKYSDYPFQPWASEIILQDINDDNFKVKMFQQILQDDGTYKHGTSTEIGLDIINELLSVTPMYWGV